MVRISPKQIFVGLLCLVVLIYALISILLLQLNPQDFSRDGFFATIEGTVYSNATGAKPQFVTVYAMSALNEDKTALNAGNSIEVANIHWSGDEGTYSISFHLPIEMEVIVTPDAQGCNHEFVRINSESPLKSVDLQHSGDRCYHKLQIPETSDALIARLRGNLPRLTSQNNELDSTSIYKSLIKEDADRAWSLFEDAGREVNESQAYFYALQSYWYESRGTYRLRLADLTTCVNESMELLSLNDSCSIIPYEHKELLLNKNNTLSFFDDHWKYSPPEDVNSLQTDISKMNSDSNRLNDDVRLCHDSLRVSRNSLSSQGTICRARNYTIFSLPWLEKFIWLLLGMVLVLFARGRIREWIEK